MKKIIVAVSILIVLSAAYFISKSNIMVNAKVSDDDHREANLSNTEYLIKTYYLENGALPENLKIISYGNPLVSKMTVDPVSEKEFEYKIIAEREVNGVKYPVYELCAHFDDDGSINNATWIPASSGTMISPSMAPPQEYKVDLHIENSRFTTHAKGNYCFDIPLSTQKNSSPDTISPTDVTGLNRPQF